jgi:DNA primase
LHHCQRPIRQTLYRGKPIEYIEATLEDIATANRLAHEVLGRLLDELLPQTRRLLLFIDQMVNEDCQRLKMERNDYRFSRRDVRRYTEWGDTQLRVHLQRLEEPEYLIVHRCGRGQSFVYELLFERSAGDDRPVLPACSIPSTWKSTRMKKRTRGQRASSRGQHGGKTEGSRGARGLRPSQ